MSDRHEYPNARPGQKSSGAEPYRRPAPVSGRPTAQKRPGLTAGDAFEADFGNLGGEPAPAEDARGSSRQDVARAASGSGGGKAGKKPAPRRRRRKLRRSLMRGGILVLAVAAILLVSWVITRTIQGWGRQDTSGSEDTSGLTLPQDGAVLPTLPAMDNDTWNFVGPVEQAEPAQVTAPDRRMIALPENGRVDLQYFDNVVFVGDSITVGLQSWGIIPNAKYCAYVGVGPKQMYDGSTWSPPNGEAEVPMEALVAHQPDNVYILLGTNAMVNIADDEVLLAYYSEMLDTMRANLHPEVCFYIQSITPVLQGVDPRFDADRIARLNDALAQMAFEKGMYFLDLHEALAGDDGWMRSDYGVYDDGYHLQPVGYRAWAEYLVTHTAYNRRHAHLYLEGSHYYQQTPPAEAAE